jgi:DNA-binding transcriptional LysR family regulator
MSFGILCLAPAIGEFMRRHPRVNVERVLNDRFVDLVEDRFDMAVRIGRLKDSSLIARRIAHLFVMPFAQAVDARSSFRCNNGDALREAVISGCGVAYLPTFIIFGAVAARKFDVCPTEYAREPSALYAVYPSTRNLSAKVRVFIDSLVETFGEEPYWDREIFRI